MTNINTDQPDDEPIVEEVDTFEATEAMQDMSEQFDKLCYDRHIDGQEKYGEFTFLENDLIRMIAEELADAANYMRYQFIKLMLLNNALVDQLQAEGAFKDAEKAAQFNMGSEAFKGVKDIGWGKGKGN